MHYSVHQFLSENLATSGRLPPLALVMLIVSEAKMGQEGEEEVHNKHIQNRR